MNSKIIIYGAGFAGLTTALALSKTCDDIILIEPQKKEVFEGQIQPDFRTTALSAFSKQFYSSIDFWGDIAEGAGAINDIKIIDADFIKGDSLLKLDFSSAVVSNEPMGYILENNILKQKLYDKVLNTKGIKLIFDVKANAVVSDLTSAKIIAENGDEYQAQIILATDGRGSKLRSLCGVATKDKPYNQTAITFNIQHDKPHNQTAIERFMPSGPFAVLPFKNEYISGIVWSVESSSLPAFKSLNDEQFKSEVAKRLGDSLGGFKIISDKNYYPLALKFTKTYYSGRVAFVGDAAHGIHPISGQGFNLGVKDISEITKLVSAKAVLGLDVGSEDLLKKYQSNRLYQNMQMIGATEFFNAIFSNDNKILTKARRVGISAIDKLPKVKSFFIKKAMGF